MVLIALRILFGLGAIYAVRDAVLMDHSDLKAGDVAPAYYLAVFVVVGIANALVWALVFGRKISEPLTSMFTDSTYVGEENSLLKLLRWVQGRGHDWLTCRLAFLECIHNPDQPAAFAIGLAHARRGSWLEKVFARELFRFDNAQRCLWAFEVLKRRGVDSRPHSRPEINMAFVAAERVEKPVPELLAIPKGASPPKPQRNRAIKLFEASVRTE